MVPIPQPTSSSAKAGALETANTNAPRARILRFIRVLHGQKTFLILAACYASSAANLNKAKYAQQRIVDGYGDARQYEFALAMIHYTKTCASLSLAALSNPPATAYRNLDALLDHF
jgi:hypothetical protein